MRAADWSCVRVQVFQLSCLQIFSEDELEYLLCGRRELWAVSLGVGCVMVWTCFCRRWSSGDPGMVVFTAGHADWVWVGDGCGVVQLESLPDIMKFDHGYTAASPPIRNVSGGYGG
jgi:E3 ubiquitin-protein ligase TRIP12